MPWSRSFITGLFRIFWSLHDTGKKKEDIEKYTAMAERIKTACDRETVGLGMVYPRNNPKRQKKVGREADKEGRIHLESNAWAVLSQAAPADKGKNGNGQYL